MEEDPAEVSVLAWEGGGDGRRRRSRLRGGIFSGGRQRSAASNKEVKWFNVDPDSDGLLRYWKLDGPSPSIC